MIKRVVVCFCLAVALVAATLPAGWGMASHLEGVVKAADAVDSAANSNESPENYCAHLSLALIFEDDPERLQALVDAGKRAGSDCLDERLSDPSVFAHVKPRVAVVLIQAGANVNARDPQGRTALMWAARQNLESETVKVLIEAGANVHARAENGQTALMFAAADNPVPEVAQVLIDAGADVNARSANAMGPTVLMWAAAHSYNPVVLRVLVDAGAHIDSKDRNGMTALMHAADRNCKLPIIEALLQLGADGRISSFAGKTAFDYAKDNPCVAHTDVYWRLNDARFDGPS